MFWSQSFCLLSAGGAPIEVIRQYIETQGEGKSEHRVPFSDLPDKAQKNCLQGRLGAFVLYITVCLRKRKNITRRQEKHYRLPAKYKPEFPWLKEVDSCTVQCTAAFADSL